jgi:hypothetical protein
VSAYIVRYRDRAGFVHEDGEPGHIALVGAPGSHGSPGPTVYPSRKHAEAARLRALDYFEHDAVIAGLLIVVPHPPKEATR